LRRRFFDRVERQLGDLLFLRLEHRARRAAANVMKAMQHDAADHFDRRLRVDPILTHDHPLTGFAFRTDREIHLKRSAAC
jgi:hypothetical protein